MVTMNIKYTCKKIIPFQVKRESNFNWILEFLLQCVKIKIDKNLLQNIAVIVYIVSGH